MNLKIYKFGHNLFAPTTKQPINFQFLLKLQVGMASKLNIKIASIDFKLPNYLYVYIIII
jgi:hypothetical protein